jgi:ketosteroid isomerase-like protein
MINGIKLVTMAKTYFDAWNAQDITELENLFADDVELNDWNIQVSTKETVLQANQNIFDSLHSIEAEVKDIGYNDNKVYAELIIKVVEKYEFDMLPVRDIKVLDVLTFNNDGKISSINAYKQ